MTEPPDPTLTADGLGGPTQPSVPGDAATRASPSADTPAAVPDFPPHHPAVPGYEILGELGRGGMGIVYKARQLRLNRTVALKVVLAADRLDAKALIRFLAEAEAVAAVRHANVVQVYDFGDHNGRPFLALEFVAGGTLADRLRAAGRLAPGEAAAILAAVARGVQAAHDQGIVHRDLKPGNVLLAPRSGSGDTATGSGAAGPDGAEPKITDFGLAKRGTGSDLTRTQAVMGTPAYMAPEQAAGGSKFVGPGADVYALGVVLYECLTGRRPFEDPDPWAVMRMVIADDPAPPRRYAPAVPRDLELICLKCLAKEPHRRYPSAAALADDLDRFRAGRPVTARPVGPAERAWRWARRSPALAGVVLALFAVGVGLAAALVDGYREAVARADTERRLREQESAAKDREAAARAEADRLRAAATAEAARASRVSDFLSQMFQASDPLNIFGDDVIPPSWETQRTKTAEDFLRDAAARFKTELADQPLARAKLLASVGNSFKNLGLFRDAEPLLREALALRRAHLPAGHPDVAAAEYDLGKLALDVGDFPVAVDRFRTAAVIQEAAGADEREVLNTRMFEAWATAMLGLPAAEPVLRAGLAARERLYGKYHRQTLLLRIGLVGFLLDQGRPADAVPLVPDLIAGLQAQPESQVRQLARVTIDLQAGVLIRMQAGKAASPVREVLLGQAERSLRASLATGRAALPDDHIYLSLVRHELATTLVLLGRPAEAEELYAKVLASVRKTTGLAHPKVLVLVNGYADRLARTGRVPAARALYDEVDRANRDRFGPSTHWRAILLLERAEFEARYGDPARAVAAAHEAAGLAAAGKLVPTRQATSALVFAARAIGRRDRGTAAELYQYAGRAAAGAYGDPSPELVTVTRREGEERFAAGEHAAGAALIERAGALAAALPKPLPAADRDALLAARGWVDLARGRQADAERAFREAVDLARALPTPGPLQEDATGLAAALLDAGRAADAVPFLAEAARAAERAKAADADRARAAVALAAGQLAAGDRSAHRETVHGLVRRCAGSTDAALVCEAARAAGLAPNAAGCGADDLACRLTAVLGRARPGAEGRWLALLRVRAGGPPAEVRGLLTAAPGSWAPTDHLVYGLALAKAGWAAEARAELWRADELRTAARPSAARPFAYAGGSWLNRLEERLLTAELAGLLPPPEPAPMPRAAGG